MAEGGCAFKPRHKPEKEWMRCSCEGLSRGEDACFDCAASTSSDCAWIQPTLLMPSPPDVPHAGKPSVDASAAQAAKPSWVREEQAAAFSLLAANFPQLVQAVELSDGGTWGPWAAGE